MRSFFYSGSATALLSVLGTSWVAAGPGGFAYKVSDGTRSGGHLLVTGLTAKPKSIPLRGAPIRWVKSWGGFAVQEGDLLYRVSTDGERQFVYNLAPVLERIVRSIAHKNAPSWAYDLDVSPGGDRLILLTSVDWSLREIDLRTKRVRLVASGRDIATRVGQRLRLSTESHSGVRWSPDGSQVAVALPGTKAWGEQEDESEAALIVVARHGHSARRLGSGVPLEWMGANRLLVSFTPEGGSRQDLCVYNTSGGLEALRKVSAPLLATWDGQSVLIAERGVRAWSLLRVTPNLKVLETHPLCGIPVTLTGMEAGMSRRLTEAVVGR